MPEQMSRIGRIIRLIAYLIVGFIAPCVFGFFGKDLQGGGLVPSPFDAWEFGAVVSTLILGIIFYLTFPFPQSERAFRVLSLVYIGSLALYVFTLLYAVHSDLFWPRPVAILLMGLVVLGVDLVLCIFMASDHQEEFALSVLLIDFPVMLSFVIFSTYALCCIEHHTQQKVFFSGVTAFHVLFSNLLFLILQSNILSFESHASRCVKSTVSSLRKLFHVESR